MADAMQIIDELFQKAVDTPRYQLANMARANLNTVLNYLNLVTGKVQSFAVVMGAIGTFIAADGEVSMEEYNFTLDVLQTNISYDALFNIAEAANNYNAIEKLDKLIDNSPEDVKLAFVSLCIDFIACDGHIGRDEAALCLKFLA